MQVHCLSFHGSGVQVQISWVLCSGSHLAKLRVMSGAAISSETWGPLPSSWLAQYSSLSTEFRNED